MTWINHWPMLSSEYPGDLPRIVSHGGGVQTSTLLLMAARGEIGPMPDCAIMANTGGERTATYEYLEWLREQVPFPIHLVARADYPTLAQHAIDVATGARSLKGANLPPWYTLEPDGTRGMLPKHCSGSYKRDVVLTETRRLLGFGAGERVRSDVPIVENWIGISKDEIWRCRKARQKYVHERYPLIELNMTRRDCIRWLQERQYRVPPKSSCVYCPYMTNAGRRVMRDTAPDDFAEAVRVDHAIRDGHPGLTGGCYVHRSCVPLDQADLNDDNLDQQAFPFAADCDSCGM